MKVALYKMEDAVFGPPSDVPAGNVTWGAAVPADGSVDESNALANAPDSSGLLAAPGAAELAAFARANAFQSAIDAIEHPTLSGALGTEFAKMAPMMRSGARLFESAPYIAVAPVLLPEMFADRKSVV